MSTLLRTLAVFGTRSSLAASMPSTVSLAQIFNIKGLQHVVSTAAKAQHQKTFKFFPVLSGVINRHLVDFGLVHLDLGAVEQDIFLVRVGDVGGHLDFIVVPWRKYTLPFCSSCSSTTF